MFEALNMFETPKLAEKFLFDNEIFPTSKLCLKCGNSMSLNGQSFRCGKKTCRAKEIVCDSDAVNESDVKIGSPGIIVEIDESKFEKRKHYRELTSGRKFFVRVVERRDAKTLLLIFQQHVFQVSLSEPIDSVDTED
uniref:DUF35_N domain-containing protein n=1 Tax=Strongyloides venezuelensis TaxID=75913 RepID=A0A0K0FSP8_STRVS